MGHMCRYCDLWVPHAGHSDDNIIFIRKPEVYADMADAWLTDPDARGHKVGRYYRDIVAH